MPIRIFVAGSFVHWATSIETLAGFAALATRETEIQVRSQLASTAQRLPADDAVSVIRALLSHDEDIDDPHMPLMNWWAVESHADAWSSIKLLINDPTFWQQPMVRQHIIARLMQRYAASGTADDLDHCATLLRTATDDAARNELMVGLARAFEGRSIPPLPELLADAIAEHQSKLGTSGVVLALRQGESEALTETIRTLVDSEADLGLRIELARVLGEVPHPKSVPTLIKLATGKANVDPALQRVAIGSLGLYEDDQIAKSIVAGFGSSIPDSDGLRDAACRLLASRPIWTKALLTEITQWRLRREQVPADVVQQLRSYTQPEIVQMVSEAFGRPIESSSEEKLAQIISCVASSRRQRRHQRPVRNSLQNDVQFATVIRCKERRWVRHWMATNVVTSISG